MSNFRKILAQDRQDAYERMMSELQGSIFPQDYRSNIEFQAKNMSPQDLQKFVDKVINDIEQFDKTYQEAKRFYEDFIGGTFKDYLDDMYSNSNVDPWMSGAFFWDCWKIYSTKFSSPKAFGALFSHLVNRYGTNFTQAKNQLKTLIDKVPSMVGRVENENDFIRLMLDLSSNPGDPQLNKTFQKLMINEFIRDMLIGSKDEKLSAANIVETQNLIKEIGRNKTSVEQEVIKGTDAYQTFIKNTMEQVLTNFQTLIEMKEDLYRNLELDVIQNGFDNTRMLRLRELITNGLRTKAIGEPTPTFTSGEGK